MSVKGLAYAKPNCVYMSESSSDLLLESGRVELKSKDGDSFIIPGSAANASGLLRSMGRGEVQWKITIPIETSILGKIVEFMLHHSNGEGSRLPSIELPLKSVDLNDLVPAWDVNFITSFELTTLFVRSFKRAGGPPCFSFFTTCTPTRTL